MTNQIKKANVWPITKIEPDFRIVNVQLQVYNSVSDEDLHEALCKAVYEGVGADETLGDFTKIADIAVGTE